MTTRSDIHRPSAPEFDPQAYSFVVEYDFHPETHPGINRLANEIIATYERAGHTWSGVHGAGRCDHCGAHLRYAAVMAHKPTQTLVWVGEQCLGNRFSDLTKAAFQRLRSEAKLNRERVAKAAKIGALVESHPLLAELTYPMTRGEFLDSLAGRLMRNGELTGRQIETAERAIVRQYHWQAERDVEQRQRSTRPNEHLGQVGQKITVDGEIRMVRFVDSDWGGSYLIVVETERGVVEWFSSRHQAVERGDAVRITGTVKRLGSYDDELRTTLTRAKIALLAPTP